MFILGKTPTLIDADTIDRASTIASSTIGHMRDDGFAHGIHAQTHADSAVGTAFTVRLPSMDSTALHYAIDRLEPGHIMVIDMQGATDRACVGAMVAFAAKHRGAAGFVIDGMATDLRDLEEFGIPVFARGISPRTTRILGIEGALNVPITVGGAAVVPGMLVIADPDGVVFLDPDDFTAIADRARKAQEIEPGVKEAVVGGASFSGGSGAAAKFLANHIVLT